VSALKYRIKKKTKKKDMKNIHRKGTQRSTKLNYGSPANYGSPVNYGSPANYGSLEQEEPNLQSRIPPLCAFFAFVVNFLRCTFSTIKLPGP
jgi:hypothetical protein